MADGEGRLGFFFGGIWRVASGGTLFLAIPRPVLSHTPSGGAGALRHALRDIYVALDRAIGEILQSIDDTTTVFLVSGDGMGPNYSGSHILTDLLTRMKLFNNHNLGDNGKSGEKPAGANKPSQLKTDLLSALRNMIPERVRIAVTKTLLPRSIQEKLSLRWKTAGISWSRTRAFLIENSNEGYIRINLRGREPEGIVEAGKRVSGALRRDLSDRQDYDQPRQRRACGTHGLQDRRYLSGSVPEPHAGYHHPLERRREDYD